MESAETRTLRVEFARLPAWAGWAVLAVALIFGADAAITFVRLKTDVDHAQTRIERGRAAAARRVPPEHIAAARETVQRLALPWPDLFEAIEGASSDAVALLAVEPDSQKGTVLITADTRDYLAALEYVRALSTSGALSQVHLLRHEWKGGVLEFALSAHWTRRDARGSE